MYSGLCVLAAFVTLGHAMVLSERNTRDIGRGYSDVGEVGHLGDLEDLSDEADDSDECHTNIDSSEELEYSPSGKVQDYAGGIGHSYVKSSAAASATAYSETHH